MPSCLRGFHPILKDSLQIIVCKYRQGLGRWWTPGSHFGFCLSALLGGLPQLLQRQYVLVLVVQWLAPNVLGSGQILCFRISSSPHIQKEMGLYMTLMVGGRKDLETQPLRGPAILLLDGPTLNNPEDLIISKFSFQQCI